MYCLSVSHKTSNVVVRKKLAFPDEQKKTFLDELFYSENISECLILCCRFSHKLKKLFALNEKN